MRKSTAIFCSAAAAMLAVGIANAELMPVKDFLVKKTKHEIPSGFRQMNPNGEIIKADNSANNPRKVVTQSQTTTVLFEDFNNVPDGEFVQTGNIGLRALSSIANYDCGKFMNPAYTPNSGQWYGEWVFAGTGGTVIMQCYNPMAPAILQLPLGDYSGDLILTMRVRSRPSFWGADNEVGFVTAAGRSANLSYMATVDGYGSTTSANCELGMAGTLCKLYPNDGWAEVRTTFRNESADSDGSLLLFIADACEIDWIKVEDAGTYLAAPVSEGITDFQENQFSIKWGEVRRAYNYYVDFFYANWLADKGVDEAYNFESRIPSDFTAGGAVAASGEGYQESNGVRVADGEDNALATPEYISLLNEGSVRFMFKQTMSNEDFEALEEIPTLCIDGLTEEGWRPVAENPVDGFWTAPNRYIKGQMSGEQFENQYKALRFYSKNTDDENYFIIDDLALYAPRPYALDRVVDLDPEHNHDQMSLEDYRPYIEAGYMTEEEALERVNSPFNTWHSSEYGDPCEYTFSDCVEADKEYFYRLRSHRLEVNGNGNTFTGDEIHHAFGVAAPALADAVDVSANSYTATWKDAAKAQNFIVSSYVANEINEDIPGYTIFSESFSNLEGYKTVETMEPVSADNLQTDMPGWDGEDVAKGENMLGSVDGGILISPELGVVAKGKQPYYVYFEAEGYNGETLVVQFNGLQTYALVPFEEDGTVAGTITVNEPVEGESISFYTYNGLPFAIKALEVTQDVAKGSLVRTFDARQIVPTGVQKATFSGLDADSKYAYKVVSHFQFEKESIRSAANGLYKVVDLKSGKTSDFSKVNGIEESVKVVARYTVDGLAAPETYKGLVIEKLSNGKTRKVIVR